MFLNDNLFSTGKHARMMESHIYAGGVLSSMPASQLDLVRVRHAVISRENRLGNSFPEILERKIIVLLAAPMRTLTGHRRAREKLRSSSSLPGYSSLST